MVGDDEPEEQAESETKRAETLIRELERDIVVQGLLPGHKIGEESQLARRFGLSRSVAREAIAIGEWEGFLENRRGRNGGLYVAAPSAEVAVYAVRNYLFLSGTTLDDIIGCRDLLERPLLELAMRRARPEQIDHLATLLEEQGGEVGSRLHIGQLKTFVDELSQAANLPPLTIFSAALRHCYVDRTRVSDLDDARYRRVALKVVKIRQKQVEAVISLDFATALALHVEALKLWRGFHAHPPVGTSTEAEMVQRLVQPDPATPIYEFVRQVKKSEAIARVISQRIADAGLMAGDRLGTEAELMQQMQAGRGGLREAIRILERYGIVEPARGKRGGLAVAEPKIEALLRVTQRFLLAGYAKEPNAYLSLTRMLLREGTRNAAALFGHRTGCEDAARLFPPSFDFRAPPSVQMKQWGQAVAHLCHDRALRCFILIMVELVCMRPDEREWPSFGEDVAPDMARLFDSIATGDAIWAPRQSDRLFECMWPIDH
ncbi:FadR/GntR family transcriptional regulator [Sphingobium sp.]|uniref:FadR/GntR family transcriptional regulator n=1 Tax=Sphingobium sp. TaxID=1912891 RepID=UPI002C34C99B|nr:GntR family transcriptional regulator [Sphingobium sp.]HUD90089.1 GntR family transcriptional regulator [Sphingobium sp.]